MDFHKDPNPDRARAAFGAMMKMKRIKKKLTLSTETLRHIKGASTTETYVDCPHQTAFCPPAPFPTPRLAAPAASARSSQRRPSA